MSDELQRARLSLREEEALIERKRAALNADIERAQRAQSELIKVYIRKRIYEHSHTHTFTQSRNHALTYRVGVNHADRQDP
jgi:hypothetical protein